MSLFTPDQKKRIGNGVIWFILIALTLVTIYAWGFAPSRPAGSGAGPQDISPATGWLTGGGAALIGGLKLWRQQIKPAIAEAFGIFRDVKQLQTTATETTLQVQAKVNENHSGIERVENVSNGVAAGMDIVARRNAELEEKLRHALERLDSAATVQELAGHRLEDANEKIDNLTQSLSDAREVQLASAASVDRLERELTEARNELSEARAEIAESKERIEALTKELHDAKSALAKANRNYTETKANYQRVMSLLEERGISLDNESA